jgi:hypothetical protein
LPLGSVSNLIVLVVPVLGFFASPMPASGFQEKNSPVSSALSLAASMRAASSGETTYSPLSGGTTREAIAR